VDSVLVVDDDAAFAERLVVFLEELLPGRNIIAVADGNAALTRALDLKPGNVLLDVAMPGPNGVRVANALAQALPATRIVILSGSDAPGDLPAGADYVRKDERMEDRLRELLA
jgi:two-component system response regulator AlgR